MSEWSDKGIIRIADDVVAVIASIATLETAGVTSMSGGIVEGFARKVSGRQVQKGVQVSVDEHEAKIDLRIIVKYGEKIDEVCRQVQYNVKDTVENMTGLSVQEVNIRIEGVDLEKGNELEAVASQ
jgi:uncharacterized alkaline shock family protein YloU